MGWAIMRVAMSAYDGRCDGPNARWIPPMRVVFAGRS